MRGEEEEGLMRGGKGKGRGGVQRWRSGVQGQGKPSLRGWRQQAAEIGKGNWTQLVEGVLEEEGGQVRRKSVVHALPPELLLMPLPSPITTIPNPPLSPPPDRQSVARPHLRPRGALLTQQASGGRRLLLLHLGDAHILHHGEIKE